MIARAPFYVEDSVGANPTNNDTYVADNNAVWELMHSTCKESYCWTIICPYQRSRDGQNAFAALYAHYLGASKVDNLSSEAEQNLELAQYSGENKRWN